MVVANPFVYDPRVYNEALTLVRAGYKVTVLGWDREKKFSEEEYIDNIHVIRIKNDIYSDLLKKRPLQIALFWRNGYKRVSRLNQTFDIIHCHDLDTLQLGIRLKKKWGCKLVYDAHEIYTYLLRRDMGKYAIPLFAAIERRAPKWVDHIILAEENYRSYFEKIGFRDFTIVLNTKPIFIQDYQPPQNDKFTLVYIGTLSKPRFIMELIDVISHLEDVRLIIGGLGPLENEVKRCVRNMENITYLGPIAKDRVLPLTLQSDAVVCMIDPNDLNNRIATANKQFEAMATGRPIIATRGTRVAEITEREDCGIVVDFSKEALKEGILKLKENPKLCERLGRNAFQAYKNRYNWDIDSKRLIKLYQIL